MCKTLAQNKGGYENVCQTFTTNDLCRIIECEKYSFILKDNIMTMINLYFKIAD